ncbi:MAG TPA: serine--tRNA ligase [Candidatus Saccharimonadales bacterium]|nr:serine--tRNA ligase [Candidatus Saccharimonadales bacterium]
MLDIQFIRENAAKVAEKSAQKGYDIDIPQLLGFDEERRQLIGQVEELRRQRNEVSSNMQGRKPTDEEVSKGKLLKDQLADLTHRLEAIDIEYLILLKRVPNMTADDVPIGGEEDSVEISRFGEQTTGSKDHLDFMSAKGWVDFERGAKVAGAKFYFLKGDGALLEEAIKQYALQFVLGKGFTYMTVPHMVNSRTAEGAGFSPKSSEESNEYFIEGEDMALIGTAEAPLTGYHADEILNEEDLPLLYVGYSPCYRKEAGTYGKHTRGLFRVHQFNKLEMYAFTLPEKSIEMHETIRSIEEELWQSLGIPYHIINIASGDLGAPAAKKYDLEYWSKVDATYRELTSCSNCTDFQARNLNIRVRRKNGSVEFVHTLNGTATALARSLVAIVEHYQEEDGMLRVPDVLRPFMGNRSVI